MAVLTGIYVVVGGYMATAVNDFIQGLIMLVGICAVIASVLNGNGGFTAAVESLSQIPSESAPNLNGAFVSFLGPQPIYLLGVVMLTSLGTWGSAGFTASPSNTRRPVRRFTTVLSRRCWPPFRT